MSRRRLVDSNFEEVHPAGRVTECHTHVNVIARIRDASRRFIRVLASSSVSPRKTHSLVDLNFRALFARSMAVSGREKNSRSLALSPYILNLKSALHAENLSILLLTPYSFHPHWHYLTFSSGIDVECQDLYPNPILTALLTVLRHHEEKLLDSLNRNSTLASTAFQSDFTNPAWSHTVLLFTVFDRFCWTLSNRQSMANTGLFQSQLSRHGQQPATDDGQLPEVRSFSRTFSEDQNPGTQAIQILPGLDPVVSSLLLGMINATSKSSLLRAKHRFCQVALSIKAIMVG